MATVKTKKVTPFLWFDDNAIEAAKFYCSIFKKSNLGTAAGAKKGKTMGVVFSLEGQVIHALNGGPHYKLSPAFSLSVSCKDQKEVDYYWSRLLKGGQESRCGWLVDKFGLSWQIVPEVLPKLLASKDAAKAGRVLNAMMGMVKLDVKGLEAAARG
jgi:predicted 3-demethylubiquinone-9 3-methyltransferase (glyoxalase superfamily)